MKKIVVIFFLVHISISGQNKIRFDFDYARFYYDSTHTYLELYYYIEQSDLTIKEINDVKKVNGEFGIRISKIYSNEVFVNKKYNINNVLQTENEKKGLIGVLGYILPEGDYNIFLSLVDNFDSAKNDTIVDRVRINPFISNKYMLSDIQIASNILTQSTNENSLFYKNSLEVIPNIFNLYTLQNPILFYYTELYNLQHEESDEPLLLERKLYDADNNVIFFDDKEISREYNSIVEVGTLNLLKYPSGKYTFALNLTNRKRNYGVTSTKVIYLDNPDVDKDIKLENYNIVSSVYSRMSLSELNEMFSFSKYIASEDELEMFNGLSSAEEKREFLYQFWKKRDKNKSTLINEFKNRYINDVIFVNEKYGSLNQKGSETDRGRVYLTYGEPDEIEIHPSGINSKPYEIWYYHSLEGGVEFVFADLTGIDNYTLIHSTKRGELRDENWRDRIKAN